MDALLQRIEVQPVVGRDDHLAVDDGALRERVACSGSISSGKYRSSASAFRLAMWTLSPSRKTIARKPSHFGS